MSKIRDTSLVFLNNSFIKSEFASINIDDRGFRYGDGVFETIRVNEGCLFKFNSHFARLKNGLNNLKIKFDLSGLEDICEELLQKNKIKNGFVRIAISRGVGSEGYLPKGDNKPTFLVQTNEVCVDNDNNNQVDLWLSSYRKIPDICIPSNCKTAQGLNSSLARIEAQENGCFEALLLSVEGKICEASSGNIFWVKDGIIYTPENNILKGVMREAVIETSPLKVVQGDFVLDDLKNADEVFITNVSWVAKSVKLLQPNGWCWNQIGICKEVRNSLF